MDKPKQLIILGGGYSIKEGIDKGLWTKLIGKWTIGLNYMLFYFTSTMLSFVDIKFYKEQRTNLSLLDLIVGKLHKDYKFLNNTILLKAKDNGYDRNLKQGVYKSSLTGLFSLSLAIHLLDEGEIFLLGYDFGGNGKIDKNKKEITHFYQGKINHGGIGKTNYYRGIIQRKPRADRDFRVYEKENKIRIYNVSTISKINTFPKLTYDQFFKKLHNKHYNQEAIRNYVKEKLK